MRLIDADALIKKWEQTKGLPIPYCDLIADAIIGAAKEAPTVDPEPKWIPFDERSPEYGQDILVTIHIKDIDDELSVQFDTYFDDARLDSNFRIDREVFAWMPIPEPYREDD